ncbi:MAG: alpha-mannosidase [Candidatus Hermodarchaeota archaeon]
MKANEIIIVPHTHWDREWYITFQEFRARLVVMMDKLLHILKTNPEYNNFTFDGQVIPLEDYLEVRPEREEEIKKYVEEGRLSVGPMYVLPDEFLVSGESLIRNLLIGHQIAQKFGNIMKAGYIPDPFGHIAQLPQILKGFEIPSILFQRGFGNEFEEKSLNLEFKWNAPGNSASILAIHLIFGYGSLSALNTKKYKEIYKKAFTKIESMIKNFEKYTCTPIVLLNSGDDHHEALGEIPEIVNQWNDLHPEIKMIQSDFEYYINKVLGSNPNLKEFQGELRGGRYANILSGVFSARMWIKQRNTAIEYLYEKYTEPASTFTWVLDKYHKFVYPKNYILTGLKWLQKNAPHDSICGCSIDEVHNEMKTRFDWAEQIANEIYKDSILYLSNLIKINSAYKYRNVLLVFNPLPWKRRDIVEFNLISKDTKGAKLPFNIKIVDSDDKEIHWQDSSVEEIPRFIRQTSISHKISFLAEIPAYGYNVFYVMPSKSEINNLFSPDNFEITRDFLENEYYRVDITSEGFINVTDKESGIVYDKICNFEDVGDWGDSYDFSGPKSNQTDLRFTTEDAAIFERSVYINGPTQKTFKLRLNLKLPHSLTEDRYNREEWLIDNKITLYISLYKNIKRIDFKIEMENNSRDHRIRVLFPTKIKADKVHADGHFYVVPRNVDLPNGDNWEQKPMPTNHQKDFISVSSQNGTFAVLNKGLPEYEAIRNKDNSIIFAITLLRCIEWLSRDDFQSRYVPAGPAFKTPEAQCLGTHSFELSIITSNKENWIDSKIHRRGKEFNNPFKPVFPAMVESPIRTSDKVVLRPFGIVSIFYKSKTELLESYLPPTLSFLEIDNEYIVLSCIKKAEVGEHLIIRLFNVSSSRQNGKLTFYDKLIVKNAEKVNFLEEVPKNEIKAYIDNFKNNVIEVNLEPHVIATFKIDISFVE